MVLVDVVVVAFGVGLVATRIDLTQPLFSPLAKRVCVPFVLGRFLFFPLANEVRVFPCSVEDGAVDFRERGAGHGHGGECL